MVNTIEQI